MNRVILMFLLLTWNGVVLADTTCTESDCGGTDECNPPQPLPCCVASSSFKPCMGVCQYFTGIGCGRGYGLYTNGWDCSSCTPPTVAPATTAPACVPGDCAVDLCNTSSCRDSCGNWQPGQKDCSGPPTSPPACGSGTYVSWMGCDGSGSCVPMPGCGVDDCSACPGSTVLPASGPATTAPPETTGPATAPPPVSFPPPRGGSIQLQGSNIREVPPQ